MRDVWAARADREAAATDEAGGGSGPSVSATQAEACATEKGYYFASLRATAPFFITKFTLRMDSMSSRGFEGMAMMSA